MKINLLSLFFILKLTLSVAQIQPIKLHWLNGSTTAIKTGISWGVPFERGKVKPNAPFILKNKNGETLSLQTWTNAYWDDGSLKWLGLATATPPQKTDNFELTLGGVNPVHQTSDIVHLTETPLSISLKNGKTSCKIPKSGTILLDSLKINDKLIGINGHIKCLWQNAPDEDFSNEIKKGKLVSKIHNVEIEQKGDIKTVIKVEGVFVSPSEEYNTKPFEFLPFIVRFYFYAGVENIRIVQTLIYDGEGEKDFIKGIGWEFGVPMREQILNRHVRFGGEKDGIWAEPIQPLTGRRPLILDKKDIYETQFQGKRVPNAEFYTKAGQDLIRDWAIWRDFRLTQHTADGFSIQKRAHDKGAWIDPNAGTRARGLVFIGDVSGGLTLGIRHFWQAYPAAMEVKNAASDVALLRGWLWSPYGEAMDMRHYDTLTYGHGLEASYEDVQPGFSTAQGVARTSELTLFLHDSVPSNTVFSEMAELIETPPLLVATPQYLHDAGAFGVWSLPNRTAKGAQWIENQLDTAILFYQKEIEQRRWYGFWNYGDVMHSYDQVRHAWRYDIGGFAWANTELVPDLWLWYSFLRTGRADIFQMAEAMTRHTSEVDVYHLGKFSGLGSRHNVRHWGCGAKEVRVSQAALKRFYYYLTTDERTGELMREVVNADDALVKTDPLRLILPKSEYPTHARIGPDWLALVGNWMTEWERTGNTVWRDKIERGVKSFSKMPYGFFSGKEGAFGYDNKTGDMFQLSPTDIGQSHLSVLMGGPEVAYEISRYIKDPDWQRLWLQYCDMYGASQEETFKTFQKSVQLGDLSPHFCRLPAYYAFQKQDKKRAEQVWAIFLNAKYYKQNSEFPSKIVAVPEVLRSLWEVPNVSTNNTAQWCLNAIELLEMIGKDLPVNSVLWDK
jgi:YetA-like protein